jgi:hypothetical protein
MYVPPQSGGFVNESLDIRKMSGLSPFHGIEKKNPETLQLDVFSAVQLIVVPNKNISSEK